MKILIDMQAVQSASKCRGIGRYSHDFVTAILKKNKKHEICLLFNSCFIFDDIDLIQHARRFIPKKNIFYFDPVFHVKGLSNAPEWKARTNELLRQYVISSISPDLLLVTSLFEGYCDPCVISIEPEANPIKTCVIFYDLIPYLNPTDYLVDSIYKKFYMRKIEFLKKADCYAAISHFAKSELQTILSIPEDSIFTVNGASHDGFYSFTLTDTERLRFRNSYGIPRDYVLFVPGGADARKNIKRTVEAFSLLPDGLLSRYCLVVVGGGLCFTSSKDVLFVGRVSDECLLNFYNDAALSIFPSLHEGLGMSLLEAVACHCPVIVSEKTAMSEIMENHPFLLFNPLSVISISERLAAVLSDSVLMDKIKKISEERSLAYTWDKSAELFYSYIEKHEFKPQVEKEYNVKRLAIVSPLSPCKTGIAGYVERLLPDMNDYFDITLVACQNEVSLASDYQYIKVLTSIEFSLCAHQFDFILYHFGNNPYHSFMLELLARFPGVVVLHDYTISSLYYGSEVQFLSRSGIFLEELYYSHGYQAVQFYLNDQSEGKSKTRHLYSCNRAIVNLSKGVILHSKLSVEKLKNQYKDQKKELQCCYMPLAQNPYYFKNKETIKERLGFSKDTFIVVSLGFIAETKCSHELVVAWSQSELSKKDNCYLIFVGDSPADDYGDKLLKLVTQAGKSNVMITGWIDDANYLSYLEAADIGVQLRLNSNGETSLSALEVLSAGIPLIVNNYGAQKEIPESVCYKLQERFLVSELTQAIEDLYASHSKRSALGEGSRIYIENHHAYPIIAKKYAEMIPSFYSSTLTSASIVKQLVAISGFPKKNKSLLYGLSEYISYIEDRQISEKVVWVDITTLILSDRGSGIERVVKSLLKELILLSDGSLRIEPVYLTKNKNGIFEYRYARHYMAQLLHINWDVSDNCVKPNIGDICFLLGYDVDLTVAAARANLYKEWELRGIKFIMMVYDILPITWPQFFPSWARSMFESFFGEMKKIINKYICISDFTKKELSRWLKSSFCSIQDSQAFVMSMGADFEHSFASSGLSRKEKKVASLLHKKSSFLMVGTIEPRKGYLQVLKAFEALWSRGDDVALVIVGREGWVGLPSNERKTIPATIKLIKNLQDRFPNNIYWFSGASDEFLALLYNSCNALIAASEVEGFGLPLIEAAQAGLPIIARDIAVFREVLGEFAVFFSSQDFEEFAGCMESVLTGQRRLVSPSFSFAQWSESAAEVQAFLEAIQ